MTRLPIRASLTLIELCAVALAALATAQFILVLLGGTGINPAPPPRSAQAQTFKSEIRFGGLDAVFGRALATDMEAQAVRPSQLDLKVFGLRARPNGTGSAIVSLDDGAQELVFVGQDLRPALRIASIDTHGITLSRKGRLERVLLDPQGESPNALATRIAQQADPIAAAIAAFDLTPFAHKTRRDNRPGGFEIGIGAEPALLQMLQLKRRDVLVSVNGTRLSSFERIARLPKIISETTAITVELERDGTRFTKTLDMAELHKTLGG